MTVEVDTVSKITPFTYIEVHVIPIPFQTTKMVFMIDSAVAHLFL